ncbi:unnamed protein product [Gordionus sp. m RMFG-2023]
MWDYLVLSSTLVISAVVGLYFAITGGKQSTTREIFLGNRKMHPIPVACSIFASFMSGVSLLGLAAESYTFGWEYWQICTTFITVILASNYFYLPVFYHYKLTSTFEYLEKRFHKYIRIAGCVTFVMLTILYMGIVMYAPAIALNEVTKFPTYASIVVIGLVCTFYTSIGGMKAVIWTDAIQCAFMFAGIIAIIWRGASEVGGMGIVFKRAIEGKRIYVFNYNPNPFIRHTFWSINVGGFFMWLSIFAVNQAQVQRCLSCTSLKMGKKAMLYALPGLIAFMTVCSLCGIVIYALYYKCDPLTMRYIKTSDQLLPYVVMDIMNYPGLPGLFISSLFSGSLSTMSSGLNSLAAVILEDIIKVYFTKIPENKGALWSKIISIFFGLVIIGMAFLSAHLGTVLQASLTIFGVVGGPMLGLFTLGMFFPWANTIGSLIGWIISFIVVLWLGVGALFYKVVEQKAPMSIENCEIPLVLTHSQYFFKASNIRPNEKIPLLYKLSYLHLGLVAVFLVIGIGLLTSYFTGFQDPNKLDPHLISPPLRKFYRFLATRFNWKLNIDSKFYEDTNMITDSPQKIEDGDNLIKESSLSD